VRLFQCSPSETWLNFGHVYLSDIYVEISLSLFVFEFRTFFLKPKEQSLEKSLQD